VTASAEQRPGASIALKVEYACKLNRFGSVVGGVGKGSQWIRGDRPVA